MNPRIKKIYTEFLMVYWKDLKDDCAGVDWSHFASYKIQWYAM
jgi:hypothetical protein